MCLFQWEEFFFFCNDYFHTETLVSVTLDVRVVLVKLEHERCSYLKIHQINHIGGMNISVKKEPYYVTQHFALDNYNKLCMLMI